MAVEKICKLCGRPIIFPPGMPQNAINATRYHPECAEYHRGLYKESWEAGNRRRGRDLNAKYRRDLAARDTLIGDYRKDVSKLHEALRQVERLEDIVKHLVKRVDQLEQESIYQHQEISTLRKALKHLGGRT